MQKCTNSRRTLAVRMRKNMYKLPNVVSVHCRMQYGMTETIMPATKEAV